VLAKSKISWLVEILTSTRLDRLPTELSQTICELVEIEGIQSLRLVSKLMKKLATPFLLSEMQLVFHPDSFERLLAISRHPELSKQVKILYYEPDAWDKHETQNSWEKSFGTREISTLFLSGPH